MLLASVALLLAAILIAGFPSLAMAQQTTTGAEATTTTTPPSPTAPDTTGPTIHVGDIEVLLGAGSTGSETGYYVTASDNVDGTAELNQGSRLIQDEKPGDILIYCNPPSRSKIYPVGDHRVQCIATDSNGNYAQAAFTIKVRSVLAPGDPSTIKASLSANPANYEGPCPVKIDFIATITGVGPLAVKYRWTDSDGYLGSTILGTLVSDKLKPYRTWELGDINVQPSFQGWMALEILEPVQLYSNVAWVSITCTSAVPAGARDTKVPTLTQSGGVQINHIDDNTASVGYQVTAQDDVDGAATLDVNNVLTQDPYAGGSIVGGDITISCNPASGSVLPIGDHTVQCSATDALGRKGTVSFTVSVPGPSATTPGLSTTPAAVDTSLKVDITAEGTTTGPAPFTFQASASVSGGTSPYTYSWNFGDGQTSNEVSTQHQFQQPGTYNVALTVTDANGKTASDSIVVTVSAAEAEAATTTTAEEDTTTVTDEDDTTTADEGEAGDTGDGDGADGTEDGGGEPPSPATTEEEAPAEGDEGAAESAPANEGGG